MEQPRSANGPKPIRVWGNKDITWPCKAAGGRDGTKAWVALATDFSGRLFVMLMPMVGACGLRFAMGALGAKWNPLAPELAIPVWVDVKWVGLQLDGVNRAK